MKSGGMPGSIVLISTMQAVALFPGSTAYAGAKVALLHAARILAKEYRGPSNIRVNVISPGVIAAGMAEASIATGKYNRFRDEGVVDRFGPPQDVARAVRFFLEPDTYVTGQVLSVDRGLPIVSSQYGARCASPRFFALPRRGAARPPRYRLRQVAL